MKKQQQHPDITWRGFVFKQWYGSPRTAELEADDLDGRPFANIKVNYVGGKPFTYDANISDMRRVYSAPTPEQALEDARAALLALAEKVK